MIQAIQLHDVPNANHVILVVVFKIQFLDQILALTWNQRYYRKRERLKLEIESKGALKTKLYDKIDFPH